MEDEERLTRETEPPKPQVTPVPSNKSGTNQEHGDSLGKLFSGDKSDSSTPPKANAEVTAEK